MNPLAVGVELCRVFMLQGKLKNALRLGNLLELFMEIEGEEL